MCVIRIAGVSNYSSDYLEKLISSARLKLTFQL